MDIPHILNCLCFCNKPGFALTKTDFPVKPRKPCLHCSYVAAVSIATCLQLEAREGIAGMPLWKKTCLSLLKFCCFSFSNNLECLRLSSPDRRLGAHPDVKHKTAQTVGEKTVRYLHGCESYRDSWTSKDK